MSEAQGSAAPSAAPAPAESSAPIESEVSEASDASSDVEEVSDEAIDAASAEETVDPKEAKKVKEEIKNLKKKLKAKVNGRQIDVEIDPNNEEELLRYVQKALASDEKFEEAANLRKSVSQLVEALKTNPLEILRRPELGIDIKALAEQVLNQELEDMSKTPEQKKLEEMERKLKEYEEERTKLEEAKRQAEISKFQEEAFRQLDEDITGALATSDLPKSPYVIKRIADTMIEAVNLGYADVSVKDILPIVEQQIQEEIRNMFEVAPEDVLEKLTDKYVGKSTLNKMRQKRLAKTKKPVETAKNVKETGTTSKTEANKQSTDSKKKFNDLFGKF